MDAAASLLAGQRSRRNTTRTRRQPRRTGAAQIPFVSIFYQAPTVIESDDRSGKARCCRLTCSMRLEAKLADRIFYAAATDQKLPHPITGYVPSKFLMRNGAYVMNPIPGGSQLANLYSDSSGNNRTDGRIANPNNYVVVPANYNEQGARKFAAVLAAASRIGSGPTLALMTSAFWSGGSQELQRNPQWGIPPNSFVRAYTSAASDHFGYITAAAGLPRELAEAGGGLHNRYSKLRGNDVDVSGVRGLSRINEANLAQGFVAGLAASQPPAPFNDYG